MSLTKSVNVYRVVVRRVPGSSEISGWLFLIITGIYIDLRAKNEARSITPWQILLPESRFCLHLEAKDI